MARNFAQTDGGDGMRPDPEDGDEPVVINAYRSPQKAHDHALVVASMGLPYWLRRQGHRLELVVPGEREKDVRVQLRKFDRENRRWPPRSLAQVEEEDSPVVPLVLWALVLGGMHFLQVQFGRGFEEPLLNSAQGAIGEGQLWRPFTSLLLHGDLSHLAGNVFSGACFAWLAQSTFGWARAWVLIILSGYVGNLLTAWLQYPDAYTALGASTAVFGAVGLLAGAAMGRGFNPQGLTHWRARLVPLVGGLAILFWLGGGTPGSNTDILAHAMGFAAGVALGVPGVLLWRSNGAEDATGNRPEARRRPVRSPPAHG